ncbi:ATP-binding protein [Methylopila turkensis]|uniref:YhaN AAA domain-containing protein n=1 Tax=Methylopila turkensis TaxID=1437816 RepID=A0A9W6N779_9HYPH|nr:YhaN family protein [Methylopila turkensis]GLK80112.1 hypothetical protein GCM10008174_18530 [Methylopila turkensis]
MRFAKLALERYGRFDGCELSFRSGDPDLHIIYGGNEAGKSTSLAAISDLLFGFPGRSPYNFVFDNALLRVGAELEEDAARLACRRRKGNVGTLLDAQDQAIDEAPLLAMLRGYTRDTFRLSFSLNQVGLREGGRAIVEGSNDLGRTLFAAGSGLTGVSDKLAALDGEIDAIWGPHASNKRSFTQAHRELTERSRAARDDALKPRVWLDAKAAVERAGQALEDARKRSAAVLEELSAAQRVRRLAPLVRLRAEKAAQLADQADVVEIEPSRAEAAETAISEAGIAERAKATAERLRDEAKGRIQSTEADPTILEDAEALDRLVEGAGASEKAAFDLVRLKAEQDGLAEDIETLRREAGANADAQPTRAAAASLRDLSRRHGELTSALGELAETRRTLEERRESALLRLKAADAGDAPQALLTAVDAARAFGADADERCDAAASAATACESALPALIARLAPWRGEVDALLRLPVLTADEIDRAKSALAEFEGQRQRELAEARRLDDEAATFELEAAGLEAGHAISGEDIELARSDRSAHWAPLRDHMLTGAAIPDPAQAVEAFELTVARADERSDSRFAVAEASSRLALSRQHRSDRELKARQAERRAGLAAEELAKARGEWRKRLVDAGLPDLDPTQLAGWQENRVLVEAKQVELEALRDEANVLDRRRRTMIDGLKAVIGDAEPAPGAALAPILAIGERLRTQSENVVRQRALDQKELDQADLDLAALTRRSQPQQQALEANDGAWRETLKASGLSLERATAAVVLDLLDSLREAVEAHAKLGRRIEGIKRDAGDHAERIEALAKRHSVPGDDAVATLRTLRARLTLARERDAIVRTLADEVARREKEALEADASLQAADAALVALMTETGAADRAALTTAIERSRAKRDVRLAHAETETRIISEGDGFSLGDLVAAVDASDPDQIAGRVAALEAAHAEISAEVAERGEEHGAARRAFEDIDAGDASAADAAADAEQARAELDVLAEHYILKRSEALILRWAIEKYREQFQDPLLTRASDLFSTLTVGAHLGLRIDTEAETPRLLGLLKDGRSAVRVDDMSEGAADQLFLALRVAAVEQSVAAGVRLPFLADDLFVNFDNERAAAGFQVLAELAKTTQVLFFTHHPHLVEIAKSVVGADAHSECALT